VGNIGRGGRSGKVGGGGEEIGAGEVPQVDKGVWEEAVGEDAYKKVVGSCDRHERGVHAEKRESVPFVKRKKGGSEGIYEGAIEEGVHLAVQITTNSPGVLCRKEGWEKEDGARLSLSK